MTYYRNRQQTYRHNIATSHIIKTTMAETLPDSFKNARPGGGFGGPQVGLIKPYEISKN